MQRTPRRAFTLSSLLASIASGLVLLSLLTVTSCSGDSESSAKSDTNPFARVPAAQDRPKSSSGIGLTALARARNNAKSAKDASQLRQVHTAVANYATMDKSQRYLRPGLVWRLPINDQVIIGQGPERNSVNTSRNFYSAMIAENFLPTSVLISPVEVNPNVQEDLDYDFSIVDPVNSVFWDPSFATDISNASGECNASYAHLAICGKRKGVRWRDGTKTSAIEPVFSNRGIEDGVQAGEDYTKSPTLQFHDPQERWVGNVVYNDNHTTREETFYPPAVSYVDQDSVAGLMKDNIFAAEFGSGTSGPDSGAAAADTWLIIVIGASTDGHICLAGWDRLLD